MARNLNTLSVGIKQAFTLLRVNGTSNTFLFLGQPGVGKSALLKMLADAMPDYLPCYVDAANLDLGDLGMPIIDRERGFTSYAPNVRFGIYPGQTRPVLLMIDELGKASRPVLNMLLPVLNEDRLCDLMLPEGSIVFATSNLATDGVGDNIPAHAYNRMTVVDMRNPTFEEWAEWALNNGIVPEVLAFARENAQVFQRYDELDKNEKNPYIFNPVGGSTKCFCSPRSLERASHLIKNRDALGDTLMPALAGTVGEAAARDMDAMVNLADQLPPFAAVIKDPKGCKLPGGVGAYFLMAFNLATRADDTNLDAIMTYTERWTDSFEAFTLFMTSLAGNKSKTAMACKNRRFTQACAKIGKFF